MALTTPVPRFSKRGRFFALCFALGFSIAIIGLELPGLLTQENRGNLGYSYTRFRKEGTAFELYAEDIWRNGRRTLKTAFDPDACVVAYLKQWAVHWSEITCTAEDQGGRRWQYTTRYNNNFTLLFFLPFFVNTGLTRELKIISPSNLHQGGRNDMG